MSLSDLASDLLIDGWDWLRGRRPHGGIHPEPHRQRSLRSQIMTTPVPEYLVIPLHQYGGALAPVIVAVGETVLKGQPLTDSDHIDSCPVHAPTSGIIEGIGRYPIAAEVPTDAACILLRSDGDDRWTELQPVPNWEALSPQQLTTLIQRAGIAGLGGADFPLAQTLRSLQGKALDSLIINAVECEPYITCDQALLRTYAADVITGAKILQHITGARETVICLSRRQQDAEDAVRVQLPHSDIRLRIIADTYTAGSEESLVQRITGREIPRGYNPADIGVLVCDTGTVFAVARAVMSGRPLISRITTLCGETLATPKNFEVLIGTPVFFLLELCGIDYARVSRVICGGALTGFTLTDLKVPVNKHSNCLIAGSAREFPALPEPMACIRCGLCASACPVSLQPQLLYDLVRHENFAEAQPQGVRDCIDCGACAWVCPSHIPLLQYFRHANSRLELQADQRERSAQWQQRYEFRQYRLSQPQEKKPSVDVPAVTAPAPASDNPAFDRDQARQDIAAAVARVTARRRNVIASSRAPDDDSEEGQR